jgi:hypothetical protein
MNAIIEKLLKEFGLFILKQLLDNRSLLIDFLKAEAKKTDNSLDDIVVGIISDYLDGLAKTMGA